MEASAIESDLSACPHKLVEHCSWQAASHNTRSTEGFEIRSSRRSQSERGILAASWSVISFAQSARGFGERRGIPSRESRPLAGGSKGFRGNSRGAGVVTGAAPTPRTRGGDARCPGLRRPPRCLSQRLCSAAPMIGPADAVAVDCRGPLNHRNGAYVSRTWEHANRLGLVIGGVRLRALTLQDALPTASMPPLELHRDRAADSPPGGTGGRPVGGGDRLVALGEPQGMTRWR